MPEQAVQCAWYDRLFREEGVPESEIVDQPKRPLFLEVSLGVFAGRGDEEDGHGRE